MMRNHASRRGAYVLGSFVDALSWDETITQILSWGRNRESRTVCLCNVHSSITAHDNAELAAALSAADMVLPDGAPIAFMLRREGFKDQARIAGPDLMLRLCAALEGETTGIFLFGADERTLPMLTDRLKLLFPKLIIRGARSPRFGAWDAALEEYYIDEINNAKAGIVFVGLGCPRQEIWMAKRRNNIQGVLLGVGAAFDFNAGTVARAPELMQRLCLEWLHRLISEPRRLWRRYLVTNSRFIFLAGKELVIRSRGKS